MRAVGTVANYLSGVKTLHLLQGVHLDSFKDISVKLVLKGAGKVLQHVVRQATPITPVILLDLENHLDLGDPVDATWWALFLLCFFLLLRKSNVVPVSVASFDPRKQLLRSDFVVKKGFLMVNGKWSKTNQCGERSGGLPVLSVPGSVLCPVTAYINMCSLVPAEPSDPAFGEMRGQRYVALTYRRLLLKLKTLIAATGRDPKGFSTHSFRRGGATFAFKAGIPGELIKVLGDWRSDAYLQYLHMPLEVKTDAARKLRASIQEAITHH